MSHARPGGDLLSRLSEPGAGGYRGGKIRSAEALAPRCLFIADVPNPEEGGPVPW